jgi:hypothetical protein
MRLVQVEGLLTCKGAAAEKHVFARAMLVRWAALPSSALLPCRSEYHPSPPPKLWWTVVILTDW